jgi:GT2 family glycosyltransferase
MIALPNSMPVAVIIPTYDRGDAVLQTLRRIAECTPGPAEIWVHIDVSDGRLEAILARDYPQVRVLTSPLRLGPGGGRDRCLKACTTPYAVSFDDDSYPVDADFFAVVADLFDRYPDAAILAARTWERHQVAKPRNAQLVPVADFLGCGYAIRLIAYRKTRGYLPRPVAYGMEESDIALQVFAAGWTILESADLRVLHDTDGSHRASPDIVAGSLSNIALFAFLNYPVALWGWGILQLMNYAAYCLRTGRAGGLFKGLLQIPRDSYRHRAARRPLALSAVVRFLRLRRLHGIR